MGGHLGPCVSRWALGLPSPIVRTRLGDEGGKDGVAGSSLPSSQPGGARS